MEANQIEIDLPKLNQSIKQMEKYMKENDYENYILEHHQYLRLIIALGDNSTILSIYDQLCNKLVRAGNINFKRNGNRALFTSYEFSIKIYDLLKANKYSEVKPMLFNHIHEAKKRYVGISDNILSE